jgi:SAM-dependent methyltransferase
MLESLRAKVNEPSRQAGAGRITLIQSDMRHLRLERHFALVIAPFNTVLHLYTRPDVEAFLASVKTHLAPGARLVFDFSVPRPEDLARDPDRYFGAPRFRYPGKGVVRYAEQFHYDTLEQTLRVNMRFSPHSVGADVEAWEVPLCHRQFFPREMEALLHYNGFTDQVWWADFQGELPHADADSLVVSCGCPNP